MWAAYACIVIFILYKVLDRLIRVPMTSAPTSNRDFILITGCDSGFGNLFAKRLDGKGFHVFASCLTEAGKEVLQNATSTRLNAFVMDITDEESIEKGLKHVKSCLPDNRGLWALVNNAGVSAVSARGRSEWMQKKDFANVMDVNTYGMISVTNAFLPLLKMTKGRILNTSSMVGRIAVDLEAVPYIASKFAVEGYSDCLRRELRMFDVSVHIVEPGYFATPLVEYKPMAELYRQTWNKLSPQLKNVYGKKFLELTIRKKEEKLRKLNTNLHLVVDAYEHAVLGTFPRGRYLVGNDAKYIYWSVSLVPEWLSDWYLTRDALAPDVASS